MSLTSLIDELRRRRVFRVAAFYGGIAFVVTEIVANTFGYLGIPDWFGSAIILLLIVGFPVSMILAWIFDITPEGIVRTESKTSQNQHLKPGTSNTALIAVTIAAISFGIWGRWGTFGGDDFPVIAVLPFQNYSEDATDWFADGFTDVMIAQLAKLSDVGVIARTSTMHYKRTDLTASEVGRELGATVVLEGSVLRSGGKVRITCQLIDTRTDRHIWSENYERASDDAIALQSDVAFAIAQALKQKLTPDDARKIMDMPTDNAQAYEHYLRAISLQQQIDLHPPLTTKIVLRQSSVIDELEKALALDSQFGEAHAEIVRQHGELYDSGNGEDHSPERLRLLESALARAESQLPNSTAVSIARGYYFYHYQYGYRRALEYFEPLLAQSPDSPHLLYWVGRIYLRLDRWEEGLAALVKSSNLNPQDANLATEVMEAYRSLLMYNEAERYFDRLNFMGATDRYQSRAYLEIDARNDYERAWQILAEGRLTLGPGPLDIGMFLVALDLHDTKSAQEILDTSPTLSVDYKAYFALLLAKSEGKEEEAVAKSRDYLKFKLEQPVSEKNFLFYRHVAIAAAIAGEHDLAIAFIDSSYTRMNPDIDAVQGPTALLFLAEAHIINDENELGLDLIEEAMSRLSNTTINDLDRLWAFDPILNHPRYLAIKKRLQGGR